MECGELPSITTGLFDRNAPELDFQIYPNPTKDEFWLEIPETFGTVSVEIYDTASRKVFAQQNQNGEKQSIKIELASGVYFVRVQADDRVGTKKMMVN